MKESEDETFRYVFTWIDGGADKGWVTHYEPKHRPVSMEMITAFKFLRLNLARQCPEFNFDSCYWRFTPFQSRGDSFFDGNADAAHRWFDAHDKNFSLGVKGLLEAHAAVEPFGFNLLPQMTPRSQRVLVEIDTRVVRPDAARLRLTGHRPVVTVDTRANENREESEARFDVAISFAGAEREQAARLAEAVRGEGFAVFYDDFYPEQLWGKELPVFFDEVYRWRSRYCVIFVSQAYLERMWTNHERRSAQARALEEKGKEYILPINVDGSELPGMPSTVGHVDLSLGIDRIAELLVKKLRG